MLKKRLNVYESIKHRRNEVNIAWKCKNRHYKAYNKIYRAKDKVSSRNEKELYSKNLLPGCGDSNKSIQVSAPKIEAKIKAKRHVRCFHVPHNKVQQAFLKINILA